jgi:hypothetical protein
MFAEVTGPANSLEQAIKLFPNAVRALTPIFDVALNTGVSDLDLHVAFDATPERSERDFFQNFLRENAPTPRAVRPVNTGLLSSLVEAIARHPDNLRLHRAAAHYQQALRFWSFGDETRAVGQLWMGFETLTPVAKRQEMNRVGATTQYDLATALGVELKHLDPTLRRTVLFSGDDQAYSTTKKTSDGFEHGFVALDQLRVLARSTRDISAAHLRRAIVQLSGVSEPAASQMQSEPYATPIIGFAVTKYLRGKLRGSGNPAASDQRYPSLTWQTDIKGLRPRAEGGYHLQWNENITPKLGPEVHLTDIRIELWSGDIVPPGTVTMQNADVVRAKPELSTTSGQPRHSNASPLAWSQRLMRISFLVALFVAIALVFRWFFSSQRH